VTNSLLDRPIGIYEKALAGGSWRRILTDAAAAGFDFVEMSIDESDERLARLSWPRTTRRRLVAESDAVGIPIFSICLSGHRRFGLGSADLSTRNFASEMLDCAIGLACDLGVRVVQVAGYLAYYEPTSPTSRSRYVDGLRRGLEMAARRGVMLAVENIDTTDMPSITACLALRDELASPWFQIYPDVGNLAVHSLDVLTEVALLPGAAVGVHLKDARPNQPRRVPFGSGTVPFAPIFAALAASSYAGPFTIEMWNDDPATAASMAEAALRWIRAQIRAALLHDSSQNGAPKR
jgi:predicted hexulose-6-phosphate isomerase